MSKNRAVFATSSVPNELVGALSFNGVRQKYVTEIWQNYQKVLLTTHSFKNLLLLFSLYNCRGNLLT